MQGPDGELNAQGLTFSNPIDMEYMGSSVRMVYARLWDVEDFSEADSSPTPNNVFPNYCQSLFPETSHVIRIAFSGGISSDGVTQIEPTNTQLFRVTDPLIGEEISYLGLADLGNSLAGVEGEAYNGDGDNYVDICLDLSGRQLPPRLEISLTCNPEEDSALYPPKGKPFSCVSQEVTLTEEEAFWYFSRAWQTTA